MINFRKKQAVTQICKMSDLRVSPEGEKGPFLPHPSCASAPRARMSFSGTGMAASPLPSWPTGLPPLDWCLCLGLFFPWSSGFSDHFIFLAPGCSGVCRLQVQWKERCGGEGTWPEPLPSPPWKRPTMTRDRLFAQVPPPAR